MAFVNPALLYGLALIAVPIIIHLLNFQRYKRVTFTNVAFLQVVKESTKARLRVRQWLILLARCLAIIFLVLTFAQPYFPNADSLLDKGEKAIYLDNSMSMSTQDDAGITSFDKGVQIANDMHQVNDRIQKLIIGEGLGYRQFNLNDGRPKMTDNSYTLSAVNPESISKLVQDKLGSTRDIVILSDFQSPLFHDLSPFVSDSAHHYTLVPLHTERGPNVYIDTVYLEEPVTLSDQELSLSVRFGYTGDQTYEDLNVKVLRNNTLETSQTVTLAPGTDNLFKFDIRLGSGLSHAFMIELDDRPVTFDNRFYFVIASQGKVRVAGVDIENTFIKAVYADTALFQYTALRSANMDIATLTAADLIVVEGNSLGSYGPTVRKLVEQGVSLLVIPGAGQAGNYPESLLREMNISTQARTTELPQEGATRPGNVLERPEQESPFFSGVFENVRENVAMPFAHPLFTLRGVGETLLKTRGGNEVLKSIQRDKGKVYVFTMPLATPFSDLQRHSIFVPTMYRLAFLSKAGDRPLYHVPGSNLISVDVGEREQKDAAFRLRGSNSELVPEQQLRGNRLLFRLPEENLSSGAYDLISDSAVAAQIAVNQPSLESETNIFAVEQMESRTEGTNVRIVRSKTLLSELDTQLERGGINTELWKYCLLLCLLFLAVEILLIRFMK